MWVKWVHVLYFPTKKHKFIDSVAFLDFYLFPDTCNLFSRVHSTHLIYSLGNPMWWISGKNNCSIKETSFLKHMTIVRFKCKDDNDILLARRYDLDAFARSTIIISSILIVREPKMFPSFFGRLIYVRDFLSNKFQDNKIFQSHSDVCSLQVY